jgi:hypothetical protein
VFVHLAEGGGLSVVSIKKREKKRIGGNYTESRGVEDLVVKKRTKGRKEKKIIKK